MVDFYYYSVNGDECLNGAMMERDDAYACVCLSPFHIAFVPTLRIRTHTVD